MDKKKFSLRKLVFGTLRRKLIFWFLVVAVIPIIVLGIVSFINAENIIESAGQNKITSLSGLETVADLKVNEIETFFNNLAGDMAVAQSYFNVRRNLPIVTQHINNQQNLDYIQAKKELDSQLRPFLDVKMFIEVLLLDVEGNLVYTTENVHKQDELGSIFFKFDKTHFTEGIKDIYFSDVFASDFAPSGFEILVLAPAIDLAGNPVGIIIFAIDMGPVYDLIQDYTGLGTTGETLVGRNEGDHALFINPLRHDPNAALARQAAYNVPKAFPIVEATQGRSGSGLTIDYRSEPILAAWRPLDLPSDNLQWGLVAKIDQSEVFLSIQTLRNNIIAFGITIILLVILLSFLISNSISKPIQKLRAQAEEMERGNFKPRVEIKSGDDLEELGMAFNRTAAALGAIQEEHKQIDKAKTRFISITSHELRSPMTPMKAQLQMLEQEYFGKLNEKQKAALNVVIRNADRLDKIIVDFLEISRIEAARLKFIFKKANLANTVEEVIDYMKGFMPEKKINLKMHVEKRLRINQCHPSFDTSSVQLGRMVQRYAFDLYQIFQFPCHGH